MLSWNLVFLTCVISAAVCSGVLYPGDATPDFNLPTLSGENFTNVVQGQRPPVVFYRYDDRSLFVRAEWLTDSSILGFIEHAPKTTHFVFFSDQSPKENAQYMHSRLSDLAKPDKQLLDRCHFVPVGLEAVESWISDIFLQWKCIDHGCGSDNVIFTQGGDTHVAARLDARYDWIPEVSVNLVGKVYPVTFVKDSCQSAVAPELRYSEPGSFVPASWLTDKNWKLPVADAAANYSGQIVLTSDQGCDYYTKLSYAFKHGAKGMIMYAAAGKPVMEIKCEGKSCDYAPINLPATMISYNDANIIIASLTHGPVSLSFNRTELDHFYFMSDYYGKLAEGGWFLYPALMFLDFEAMWFDYQARMDHRLKEPAKVVPVIDNMVMHGPAGANVTVAIPSFDELRHYSTVELMCELTCPGKFDLDCATWDRTMGLSVCCHGQEGTPFCNYELGRWITPFRRGIGYWLTDVTPLLPLLKSTDGKCSLAMRTDPWAQPWNVSLKMLLKNEVKSRSSAAIHASIPERKRTMVDGSGTALAPSSMVSIIHGGATFDKHFNNRTALEFKVPSGVRAVRLVSVITGHGSDNNGCGEFCVTKHVFTVNNQYNNSIEFGNAGTPLGCALNTPMGVVPNEHGTWLYGRDGWCDGQEVEPWVVDITKQVNMDGSANKILYQAYFNGHTPNPTASPGYIAVDSEVVYYTPL